MKSNDTTREMAYCKRRQSITLTNPDTKRPEVIKPHHALILADKNGVKLTSVIDGAKVMVRL